MELKKLSSLVGDLYQSPVIESLAVELEQPVLTGSAPDMAKEQWG